MGYVTRAESVVCGEQVQREWCVGNMYVKREYVACGEQVQKNK